LECTDFRVTGGDRIKRREDFINQAILTEISRRFLDKN